jgi:hypothetical protein
MRLSEELIILTTTQHVARVQEVVWYITIEHGARVHTIGPMESMLRIGLIGRVLIKEEEEEGVVLTMPSDRELQVAV